MRRWSDEHVINQGKKIDRIFGKIRAYFWVIQAGKLETWRRPVSRAASDGTTTGATTGAGAVVMGVGAAAAVVASGALLLDDAGAGVRPAGLTPYGLGEPCGGDHAP